MLRYIISHKDFLYNLVNRDLTLKYKGSYIGFLWSLLNPIVMLVVYTWAFKVIMKSTVPDFSVFLLTGLTTWSLFANTTSMAVGAITGNSGLIKKTYLNPAIFVVSNALFNLIIFAMMLIILLIAMPVFGIPYTMNLLLIIPALVLELLFVIGFGMLLSTLNVFFNDTSHLYEVLLMAWFWLTPIIYSPSLVPKEYLWFVSVNPMAFIVNLFQKAILGSEIYVNIPLSIGIIGIIFILGIMVFKKNQAQFAERI